MSKGLQRIYSEVAGKYELVNHILTLGFDIRWRKKAAKQAKKAEGSLWLDVCSGTGEMAHRLSMEAENKVKIMAADFSFPMLTKARKKFYDRQVFFILTEANSLPFPDNVFDLVTISFATRNINPDRKTLMGNLKEFHRILKPNGRFVNLETSQPSYKILKKLFHLYVKLAVKPVGYILSGSKKGYQYLSFTIPRFFSPEELSRILHESGFKHVDYCRLLSGVAAIHTAIK